MNQPYESMISFLIELKPNERKYKFKFRRPSGMSDVQLYPENVHAISMFSL